MLPLKIFRNGVTAFFPACTSGGSKEISKCRFVTVAHNKCCGFSSSASSTQSSKADLEVINKLAAEADTVDSGTAAGETGILKKDAGESSLTTRGPLPIITKRELQYVSPCRTPRQAWVENLDTIEENKLGLIDLHPDVWGAFPRVELIQANVKWQTLYRRVNWNWAPTRGEVRGPNSKPWPQKGMGKARHGDRRSPIWHKGGKAHGPRGPKTYYYMLPFFKRIHGLTSALSVKLAQDDLKIVDSLEIPRDDPKYLEDLVNARHWGISVLFVDDTDIVPKNIALATDTIAHMNIMPVYGLNVYSMLKHETLVLTLAAVNKIEEKLVYHLNRHEGIPITGRKVRHSFY